MNLNGLSLLIFTMELFRCDGYRILAIFPYHGRSHSGVLQQVAKALSRKGHQVDVISHFPLDKPFPNYTDIVQLHDPSGYVSVDYDILKAPEEQVCWITKLLKTLCSYLSNPEIINLVNEQRRNLSYDLLLVHYLSGYQCLSAIGYSLNIPVVGVVTTSLYSWMYHFVDNPLSLSISSSNHYSWENEHLNFWDRLYHVVVVHYEIYKFYRKAEIQEYYIKKYLGNNVPHHRQLEKRIQLILTNSHYSYHGVKPKSPALVEIGGIHIKNDSSPMNETLKAFLDQSTNGFIYFSFGSMVIIESFPREILEKFYVAFRKVAPVRILMRVGNPESLPGNLPNNVVTYPWLPQQQIFQHPNIIAFVTHGGGLGTQEAIYYGIPMICLPIFADQYFNCDILKRKNAALKLETDFAQQEDYDYVFQEIVSNPIYKNSIRKLSVLYRDRPRSPSEEATYWIEYVIRHGSNVLRSPVANLSWWQIELLDVYAFIAACFISTLSVTIIIVHVVFKRLFSLRKSCKSEVTSVSKKLI